VRLDPSQKSKSPEAVVTEDTGKGFTAMLRLFEENEQPAPTEVMVAEYVPDWLTVIADVVSPVFQEKLSYPEGKASDKAEP
jgi:hypothetical protein